MKKPAISILSALTGAAFGAGIVQKVSLSRSKAAQSMSDKHLALFLMMNQWVKIKQEGKSLAEYFEKNGYKKIAVYGMSYAGETLVNELKDTTITVVYGIDKRADDLNSDLDILTMEDDLEEVDAIVVTAITFYDQIEEQLMARTDSTILSLEDILYEV